MVHSGRLKLPYRGLFGPEELAAVTEVFEESWDRHQDFGFQGTFEKRYTDSFSNFQGGGFCDAVSCGTAAVWLCIKALELPEGSQILVSPVTDPGCISAVILAGHRPLIADAAPGGFNTDATQIDRVLNADVKAAVLTHSGGVPLDLGPVTDLLDIPLIEDCSQAHGATYNGKRVGTFGVSAAFSTMFSKLHASGGTGGLVYTQNEEMYWRMRSYADRGKDFKHPDFSPKDPTLNVFPSFNFHQDELSCAIGWSTLKRLPDMLRRRQEIVQHLDSSLPLTPVKIPKQGGYAPFFHTYQLEDQEALQKMQECGVPVNANYRYVVSEWPWVKKYLAGESKAVNALSFRNSSFNLLFNECFSQQDVTEVARVILDCLHHRSPKTSTGEILVCNTKNN